MRKVLIVNQFYLKQNQERLKKFEVSYAVLYESIPNYLKPFRYLHQLLGLPFFHIWYIKDFSTVFKGYDLIILHDSEVMHANYFIEKISAHTDSFTKLVYYYWNSIYDLQHLIMNEKWEIVSFDYKDALENNLRYVGGLFVPELIENKEKPIDLFFIGTNKGRFDYLLSLAENLKMLQLNIKFFLVSRSYIFNKKYSKAIPYEKVGEWLSKSKGIVELTKIGQTGLTLRAYEAIFYNKKLVSNNTFLKNYDFYEADKVYILQNTIEDAANIAAFLRGKDINFAPDVVDRYSLESFIERVDENLILSNVTI